MIPLSLPQCSLPHLLKRSRFLLGLEIGNSSLQAVVIHGTPLESRVLAAFHLPVTLTDLQRPQSLFRLLSLRFRDAGIPRGTACHMALPSALVDYQSLGLPEQDFSATPTDALAENAMRQMMGDEIHQAVFDYWLTELPSMRRELNLCWSNAEFSGQYIRAAVRAGLNPIGIEPPVCSLARVASWGPSKTQQLCIHLGGREATFVWCVAGQACYVRNQIFWSQESAAHALSGSQDVDLQSARHLLRRYGIVEATTHGIANENGRRLNEWLEGLLFEIQRTCQFLRGRNGSGAIEELCLCGETAEIPGIGQWLQNRTGLQTRVVAAPVTCGWESAEQYSPLYAPALALALQGMVL